MRFLELMATYKSVALHFLISGAHAAGILPERSLSAVRLVAVRHIYTISFCTAPFLPWNPPLSLKSLPSYLCVRFIHFLSCVNVRRTGFHLGRISSGILQYHSFPDSLYFWR